MEQDNELAESKTRTYQLIGRNVVLFQQMEQLLKIILPEATVSISSDTDVQALKKERYAAVETCTLGNLVNRFIDEVCDPNDPDPKGDSDQVHLTNTFRLKFDAPDGRDTMIKRLKDLVEGRNRLVHHLLSQVDVNSPASWRAIHDDLENQQQQVLSEIKSLEALIEALIKAMEISGAWTVHPEFKRELDYGPIREHLLEKLRTVARESSDSDGWTSLKAAIHSDCFVSPDDITRLQEIYEVSTVSAFLETVGGFEIRHDKDRKGKSRTFYRVIPAQNPSDPDPGE